MTHEWPSRIIADVLAGNRDPGTLDASLTNALRKPVYDMALEILAARRKALQNVPERLREMVEGEVKALWGARYAFPFAT